MPHGEWARFAKANTGRLWLVSLAQVAAEPRTHARPAGPALPTLYGRDILRDFGLYDARRAIQVAFILGVMCAAGVVLLLALWMARRWSWSCRLAAFGLGLQAAFVVVHAASFHHVDILLGMRLANLKINLLLESVGLIVMLAAAMTRWAQGRIKAV